MSYISSYNPSFGRLGMDVAQAWPEAPLLPRTGHKRDTLGLALSGGGYRSAIFGYGILHGLHKLGLLAQIDYLSAVSGGSWIATPFAMAEFGMVDLEARESLFRLPENKANIMEEAFESLLVNPVRLAEEAALTRPENNFISDLFGRLLAKTFLREHGDYSRWKPLASDLIRDADRLRKAEIIDGLRPRRGAREIQCARLPPKPLWQRQVSFNPQFSTAKLDYSFAEHRNLTRLGTAVVEENAKLFTDFVGRVN